MMNTTKKISEATPGEFSEFLVVIVSIVVLFFAGIYGVHLINESNKQQTQEILASNFEVLISEAKTRTILPIGPNEEFVRQPGSVLEGVWVVLGKELTGTYADFNNSRVSGKKKCDYIDKDGTRSLICQDQYGRPFVVASRKQP